MLGFDLDDLFEGSELDLVRSKPVRVALRLLFGLLGTALSGAGAWYTLGYDAGLPFRLAGVLLFVFLGAFFLVNVAFRRRAAWPWKGFIAAFVLLLLVRIVFGAR
jgi:hypothetical protein